MNIDLSGTMPHGTALVGLVTAVLERASAWLRHDLATSDPAARSRAEETLAGMIAATLTPAETHTRS